MAGVIVGAGGAPFSLSLALLLACFLAPTFDHPGYGFITPSPTGPFLTATSVLTETGTVKLAWKG
jgi:hypothetical protein